MFKRANGVLLPPPLIYLLFLAAAWALDGLLPLGAVAKPCTSPRMIVP